MRTRTPIDDDPTLDDLKGDPVWVAWQTEERNGKPTKVPYDPHSERRAAADNAATWGTRRQAQRRADNLPMPCQQGGVGIMLGERDGIGYAGIDLDSCLYDEAFLPCPAEVVERFRTYTEVSPSKTGAKLFFRYRVSDRPRLLALMAGAKHSKMFKQQSDSDHAPGIELHLSHRYFTVADALWEGSPPGLRLVEFADLEWILKVAGPRVEGEGGKKGNGKGKGFDRSRSRSRDAYVLVLNALREKRIATYGEACQLLRNAAGRIGEWAREKGDRDDEHELRNIWDNANKWLAEGGQHAPPTALGYTKDNQFVLLDPTRQIIVFFSPQRLFTAPSLLSLAPAAYWAAQYPAEEGGFSVGSAASALIAACKDAGPFDPAVVRGRGVWRDGDDIVVNLGGPIPTNSKYKYLCFQPIKIDARADCDAQRLLELLLKFRWRHKRDAYLFLGWLAIAVIRGVLKWRPHIWPWGPPKTGKSTVFGLAEALCAPLGLSFVGGTSEAGVRQTLGVDCLPTLFDEFEDDQDNVRAILRMLRVASSAEAQLVKGTREGRAQRFSVCTTAALFAVEPLPMTEADESRIVMLELLHHDGDEETRRLIEKEARYFERQRGHWVSMMVNRAELLPAAVARFESAIPSGDTRHRQNMGTLLAGAFVALYGDLPTADDLAAWTEKFAATIHSHAEEQARDTAQECLNHLLGRSTRKATIWRKRGGSLTSMKCGFWSRIKRAPPAGCASRTTRTR